MTPETTLAYLAGLIDGEGTVYQCSFKRNSETVVIEVKMTDEAPIALLRQTFGGTVCYRVNTGENRKPVWRWRASHRRAREVMEQLRPWLLLKYKVIEPPKGAWLKPKLPRR